MLHNIKVLCVMKGISMREMCRLANMCYESMYAWKNHSPSVDKLIKIAEILDCTLDEIVFGIKPKKIEE